MKVQIKYPIGMSKRFLIIAIGFIVMALWFIPAIGIGELIWHGEPIPSRHPYMLISVGISLLGYLGVFFIYIPYEMFRKKEEIVEIEIPNENISVNTIYVGDKRYNLASKMNVEIKE